MDVLVERLLEAWENDAIDDETLRTSLADAGQPAMAAKLLGAVA